MKIHHLNCGSMCPLGGHLMDGSTPGLGFANLVCHCLLIETNDGLVLVDTGFGLSDVNQPHGRLSEFFLYFNNIQLRESLTAVHQIEKMGFSRDDVRHILITHLDFDHAGGISDFPNATVHLLRTEYQAAKHVVGIKDINRYRPQQWTGFSQWQTYSSDGDRWFGFESVRDLKGLPPEILMIPLRGHTFGHTGIAIDTGSRWLFHAGDAYFFHGEMNFISPKCPLGLRGYQTAMEVDRRSRLSNQNRLRQLKHELKDHLDLLCAHDPVELAHYQRRQEMEDIASFTRTAIPNRQSHWH